MISDLTAPSTELESSCNVFMITLFTSAADLMGLKKMLQDFGQAVTHLELKNMIKQVDKTNSGTICYRDFLTMMLGPRQSVLKL